MDGGGSSEHENKNPAEGGELKVKRKMKSAFQLEILEKTYAVEAYPSEQLRADLSVQLGLTDRQLQMWFCHRRLKDRKTPPVKRSKKETAAEDVVELGANEHGGSSPFGHKDRGSAVASTSEISSLKRYHGVPEARAIAFVESQLGERLRGDGPILGMEFDPMPPGAFGAPIVQQNSAAQPYEAKVYEPSDAKLVKGGVKAVQEYQFLPEQPSVRTDSFDRAVASQYYGSPTNAATSQVMNVLPPQYGDVAGQTSSTVSLVMDTPTPHPITGIENPFVTPSVVTHEEEITRIERKRKSEEARIAKEVEAHERRIRKELEKQDMMRRKREEQMRKEMERQDRERRKEEERLLREKLREEERYQREQRREMERRVKFLQKESIRAEKLRLKEDMRREKEAARLKAANDRAAAKRIAKESMELIDDERLELLEIAAKTKGLPSMMSLDSDTLESIDSLRDMLPEFPPKSVHLKKPFKIQPWTDSEENIGNLLMVWKFLITFADVLGLWPFTLDEFIQAFHDHDPRLLGEIHVALLKSIVKDIEDVARAPLGANQTGGGHLLIVQGAFAWGFDIRSWQCHLNPLTWPEILRQFALAAGYGPKLTKRDFDQAHPHEENEGVNCGDIISNLRSGAAAENALAIMQERGFSNRRSRHRLTPGTVKFAAFHVLSLEGSKGLSILDVAEKIQRSGLRDLTTSKTPEASIAAALSRDTKLFERTAPSTYCLKSPYRKDPADRDTVINAAREKIHVFKNGYFDGEEAFDPERDDAEKDDDSESDDPEVDDIRISNLGLKSETPKVDVLGGTHLDDNNVVDESVPGESWVHGLMEGEYCDLSVEERLNALVALVAIANEGNSIRVVLEERLEAAMAIKKQMRAEAQVDKRRMKEDLIVKIQYPAADEINDDLQTHELSSGGQDSFQQPTYAVEKSRSQLKSFIGHKAEEMFVYRSLPLGCDRRRNRYWQFITSASQNDPGSGRIFVELRDGRWRLIDTEESFNDLLASLDVRGNREADLHSMLHRIEPRFKESVNRMLVSIDSNSPSSSVSFPNTNVYEFSSSFAIELRTSGKDMANALKRYEDFEKWMWGECLNLRAIKFGNTRCEHLLRICDNCRDLLLFEEDWCSSCRKSFFSSGSNHISQFKEMLKWDSEFYSHNRGSGSFRLIKAQLALIEASVPLEALQPSWTDDCRKSWCVKLVNAVTTESLLEALTLLECGIKREYLSWDFETTDELLGSANLHTHSVLPWLPETTSSVALRLMELDSSIHYLLSQKEDAEKDKGPPNFLTLHPKYAAVMHVESSLSGTGNLQDTWVDPGRGRGRGRGRRRARGGRSVGGNVSRLRTKLVEIGSRGGRGGRKGGQRGARTKQRRTVKITTNDHERDSQDFIYEESPAVGFQEWNAEEIADLRITEDNDSSSEYEIENENNVMDEYDDDDMLVDDGYPSVYDDVATQGYIGEYGLEDDDEEGGVDVDGFFNDDSDENQDVDGRKIGDNLDDETELSSSGYSD